MLATIFFELGCAGSFEMSSFHGLSGGKTCKAATILSAWGVLNMTGRVISGIFGRSALAAVSAANSRRGESHFIAGILTNGEAITARVSTIILHAAGQHTRLQPTSAQGEPARLGSGPAEEPLLAVSVLL